jgi:signal transduction histidine kinase
MLDHGSALQERVALSGGAPVRDEAARLAALEEYRLVPLGGMVGPEIPPHVLAGLRGLAQVAGRLAGSQAAVLNILTDTEQRQVAAWNIAPAVCAREDSMCTVVFEAGEVVVVPDATQDPRFVANPFVTGRIANIRFYASAPLISPGGYSLGTLCVFDTVVRELDADEAQSLHLLAEQAVDVLELGRRSRLLDESVARLTAANELLTGFAGRVSHDLKAPLGAILGFAETLADVPALAEDPAIAQRLDRIDSSGRRMNRMINDLLQYASSGGGLQVEPVAVKELVEQVVHDLEQQIDAAGARIEVSAAAPSILGDLTQLRMFLQNLVANSVKYRRPEADCLVRISSEQAGQFWLLQVADNGKGIPADQREKVLQPLVRLDRDRGGDAEGVGIGLATCERIATSHGGKLELGDTPGGGTTFTLRAPLLQRPSCDQGAPAGSPAPG